MTLGLISDTHGFLDPKIPALFKGVSHILHAGDIGKDSIIAELEAIAPVTAVLGNNDYSRHFELTEVVTIEERKFLIHHIVTPQALTEELQLRVARERPDVVVFGHSHRQFSEAIDGVLYVNPGYSGKSKLGLDRSAALLHCNGKDIRSEFLPL